MLTRIWWLSTSVLVTCFKCYSLQQHQQQHDDQAVPHQRPNVVIFIVDDLGIGDIGCYGNTTIKTPNIDSIGRQGVQFQHNIAPESVCSPSRAASLTGRYPVRLGMAQRNSRACRVVVSTLSGGGLPAEETTYASVYQQHGYSTAYFGKWHVGMHSSGGRDFKHHPLNHGFDYYYGMPLTNLNEFGEPNDFPRELSGRLLYWSPIRVSPEMIRTLICIALFNIVLVVFSNMDVVLKRFLVVMLVLTVVWGVMNILVVKVGDHLNAIVMQNYEVVEQPVYLPTLTQRVTREATSYIQRHAGDPFLAVVAYHKVHIALSVPEEYRGRSAHGLYGDSVEEVDWSVGEVLKTLQSNNLLNNTFVYFTSDHGPANYARINGEMHGGWTGGLRGGKGNNWEGGIRVPTLAMWPGLIQPGRTVNAPTSGMDLFPTLLNIIGAPFPEDRAIDGVDFMHKVSLDSPETGEDRFFFHYCGSVLTAVTYSTVVDGTNRVWKIHYQTSQCPICCHGNMVDKLKEPLIYDLLIDKQEAMPLLSTDLEYDRVKDRVGEAVHEHKLSVGDVEDQLSVEKQRPKLSLVTSCGYPWSICREELF